MEDLILDQNEAQETLLALEQRIELLETLIDLRESNTRTSDQTSVIRAAFEMANTGLAVDNDEYIKSYLNLSNEGIMDVVKNVGTHIGYYIKKEVDNIQTFYTFWSNHENEIAECGYIAKNIGRNLEISIKDNKYLHFGQDKLVKGFGQYAQEYVDMADVMSSVIREVDEFTRNDLFNSYKTFLSPFTGYDEHFEKMYNEMNTFTGNVVKATNLSKQEMGFRETYRSNNLLGMSHLEVSRANPKTNVTLINYKKLANQFYITLVRDQKFSTGMFKDSVVFTDVNSSDFKKVTNATADMASKYMEMITIRNKFSQSGAAKIVSDSIFGSFTILGMARWLLANYRLMVRMSYMIYNTNASSFVFSRGNADQFFIIKNQVKKSM